MGAERVATQNTFKSIVIGEHREGYCEQCGTKTEKEFYMDGTRKRVHAICPKCGGQGRLIVRTTAIQPPKLPQCLRFKCLWEFFKSVMLCAWLSNYHMKRVGYATRNRHKDIPEMYRTVDPSPQTLKETIRFLVRLKLRR